MNGSGLLLLNPPYRLDAVLAPTLARLGGGLGEAGARRGWNGARSRLSVVHDPGAWASRNPGPAGGGP